MGHFLLSPYQVCVPLKLGHLTSQNSFSTKFPDYGGSTVLVLDPYTPQRETWHTHCTSLKYSENLCNTTKFTHVFCVVFEPTTLDRCSFNWATEAAQLAELNHTHKGLPAHMLNPMLQVTCSLSEVIQLFPPIHHLVYIIRHHLFHLHRVSCMCMCSCMYTSLDGAHIVHCVCRQWHMWEQG